MPDIPLDGEIDKARVDWAISKLSPGDRLVINSRGGDILEALRLGKHVRENNINTHVPSTGMANSAAALVYSAGVKRTAGSGAQFLIHPGQPLKSGGKRLPSVNAFYLNSLLGFGVRGSPDMTRALNEDVVWDYKKAREYNLINEGAITKIWQ